MRVLVLVMPVNDRISPITILVISDSLRPSTLTRRSARVQTGSRRLAATTDQTLPDGVPAQTLRQAVGAWRSFLTGFYNWLEGSLGVCAALLTSRPPGIFWGHHAPGRRGSANSYPCPGWRCPPRTCRLPALLPGHRLTTRLAMPGCYASLRL